MATRDQITAFALYSIGEVESGWVWNSINYSDPITLGMWQFYGTNAAQHLHAMQDETPADYSQLSAGLRAAVESHAETDVWWNSYGLNQEDGNSWATVAEGSDQNHALQQKQMLALTESHLDSLLGWGMTLDQPRELVFMLSVFHQRPVSAQNILRSCGATATLENFYTTTLNDSIMGQYRNRYTTVYNRVRAWDGTSAPPDYGQVDAPETGGNEGTISTVASDAAYILQRGSHLVLYGQPGSDYENGLIFANVSGDRWVPVSQPGQTDISGGWDDSGSSTGGQGALDVVALYRSWLGRFAYSQAGGRLDPENTGYGDCSSTIWKAYQKVTGLDVGTYTGAMLEKGREIQRGFAGELDYSILQPADLVIISWGGSWSLASQHVELYTGDDHRLLGHGGGQGPTDKGDANAYLNRASTSRGRPYWRVRRYL